MFRPCILVIFRELEVTKLLLPIHISTTYIVTIIVVLVHYILYILQIIYDKLPYKLYTSTKIVAP